MEILLKKNELLDLDTELRGLKILCQAGVCWLTQAGDSRDHILRAGQSFCAAARGRLIVTATNDCRLMLVAAPERVHRDSFWQQFCRNS